MFKGAITALITPFKDGQVDEKAYQDFVNWQIEEGIHGVASCGTTGESPTMPHDEHNKITKLCIEAAAGRVPVMAGTGSNSTAEAISLTKHAQKAGANAALISTPYYNKPNQEGLYQHYKAIADATDIPIILYNIPGRSVVDMSDETIARLAVLPNIVGIKDATGDLSRTTSLRNKLDGQEFCLLSGEDATALAFNAQGGVGCISVTSNIAPKQVAKIQELTLAGDYKAALPLHDALIPLHSTMFCDTSPGPVKYAASLMNICQTELRLPLTEPGDSSKEIIKTAMKNYGLI